MDYFKVNYDKLRMLPQINAIKIVIFTIMLFLILIIGSLKVYVYNSFTLTGIYIENVLNISLNYEYVSNLKDGEYLKFNDEKSNYTIKSISEYEIVSGLVYQNIELELDKSFMDNEVGSVTIYYNKQKLLNYIFELFK